MKIANLTLSGKKSRAGLPLLASMAIGLLGAAGANAQASPSDTVAFQIPDRDLRQNPPAIASLTITPRGASGTQEKGLLKVRFEEAGLPSTLQFLYKGALKTLRDDGTNGDASKDGVYSAALDFDLGELLAHQNNLSASGQTQNLSSFAAANNELDLSPLAANSAHAPPAPPAPPAAPTLSIGKTLFIRDKTVVDNKQHTSDPCLSKSATDANKKWTWGYLVTQMTNQSKTGRTPSHLAMSLLTKWEKVQKVNNDLVPARPSIRDLVINPWLAASGNTGKLAMNKAPFRLLGIVNRVDLRQNLFFGEGLAGELRFVWGVLDLTNTALDGSCQKFDSFTMIMEYAVDKKNQDEVKTYAKKWVALNSITQNTPDYRNALMAITESVVKANVGAAKNRANGSALIRIRTNEIQLSGPWELREFNIRPRKATGTQPSNVGLFFETDVKQTPANEHNFTPLFADYVNTDEAPILSGKHNVPTVFRNVPFRGGASENNIDFWDAPGINNNDARFEVSVNTCNGCHGAETQTGFLHVFPRSRGTNAGLSGFLTGVQVFDPAQQSKGEPNPTLRTFNDLDRRTKDLISLTSSPTASALAFEPMARVH